MSRGHAFQWEPYQEAAASYAPSYDAGEGTRPLERVLARDDRQPSGPRNQARDWSAALDVIARAAHQHHARKDNLRDLETRIHDWLTRLEAELVDAESRARLAERRALEAERRAAEAEEWLERMYERINEHFGIVE